MSEKKKCTTCWGFGLWATGDYVPMGPMDAGDGMPSKKCPECGAHGVNVVDPDDAPWHPVGNEDARAEGMMLRQALLWVTLFDKGIMEPGEASLFLDSIPNELLPTAEEIAIAAARGE